VSQNTSVNLSTFTVRERVLAAALKLFVERGYFNTNIPDLSKESRCSVGSIYHAFKNKEEIAFALYEAGFKEFRTALYEAIKDEEECERQVKTLVRSFLRFCEVNHQLSRYMWLCRHSEFMVGFTMQPTKVGYDPLGRIITRTIKRGIRSGTLRPLKAHLIWSILFGIPLGYVRDWLEGINEVPPSQVAVELAEACWRGLT
jgi:TetR/AcrR family transcriptional regulator, repressor of fatR-cypB operon